MTTSIPELAKFYQEGFAEDIGAWIQRSIKAFLNPEYHPMVDRTLRVSVVQRAYPQSGENPAMLDLSARQTIPVCFMLGYCAGAFQDPNMSVLYEALYQTLESMHYHYRLRYGLAMGSDGDPPTMLVSVPNDPGRHLQLDVLPLTHGYEASELS